MTAGRERLRERFVVIAQARAALAAMVAAQHGLELERRTLDAHGRCTDDAGDALRAAIASHRAILGERIARLREQLRVELDAAVVSVEREHGQRP